MPWDGVPWMVGGGAEHTPDVGRVISYAAFNAEEGVLGISDLKVLAMAAPAAQVRVSTGVCAVIARSPGNTYQTYVCRMPSQDVVDVAPTLSGETRSDLVIARIEDPFDDTGAGYPIPADVKVGPYIKTRVIAGVPAGTTDIRDVAGHANDSAITLARIDLGPSTTQVLQTNIVDLRYRANPRSKRALYAESLVTGQEETLTATAAAGEAWPGSTAWTVRVPEWATYVRVQGEWNGVNVPPGNVNGYVWARLGEAANANAIETQLTGYDTMGLTQASRQTLKVADTLAVPAGLRGTTIPVYLKGRIGSIISGGDAARIKLDNATSVALDLEFAETVGS